MVFKALSQHVAIIAQRIANTSHQLNGYRFALPLELFCGLLESRQVFGPLRHTMAKLWTYIKELFPVLNVLRELSVIKSPVIFHSALTAPLLR